MILENKIKAIKKALIYSLKTRTKGLALSLRKVSSLISQIKLKARLRKEGKRRITIPLFLATTTFLLEIIVVVVVLKTLTQSLTYLLTPSIAMRLISLKRLNSLSKYLCLQPYARLYYII